MAATMVPDSEILPDVLPTGRLTASGMPVPQIRAELRRIPNGLNAWSVAALWLTTVGIAVAAVEIDHPVAWIAAFLLMGPQHARFASLGHEAAHRLLFTNKRLNDWVGRWVLGYPAFFPVDIYRRGHMAHHKDEFGPNEPDMNLYAGYPIPRSSMLRKLRRDLFVESGWKNLKGLLRGLRFDGVKVHARRIVVAQVVLLVVCSLLGWPQVWFFLWFLPWMTTWRVINRLRSIAEHGGMERSSDRRRTTHAVAQSRLAGFTLVPYKIGYHLAHHVDMGVPWRNLPQLDRELRAAGWVPDALVHPTYRELWHSLSSRPES
ncbi:MAG: fatty acid desaturase [Acidimicrobiales bacterium]